VKKFTIHVDLLFLFHVQLEVTVMAVSVTTHKYLHRCCFMVESKRLRWCNMQHIWRSAILRWLFHQLL